jgi:hypothetical protein
MDNITVQTLGNLINYGFGKSNNVLDNKVATITGKLFGDSLQLTFGTVINYDKTNPAQLDNQLKSLRSEATKAISDYMSNLKKNFKEQTGTALKCKEVSKEDDLQMMVLNSMNILATSYFRMIVKYNVE